MHSQNGLLTAQCNPRRRRPRQRAQCASAPSAGREVNLSTVRSPIPDAPTLRSGGPERTAASLFAPGRNCWRIESATQVAFLVDGEEYFTAVREALAKARHSFFILGWDIDSRMRLTPGGANDGFPEPP